jgi:DNA polymerase I
MKKLLVIDAHSIIHRAYHALPPLSTPDGQPIQAVYGLARLILAMLRSLPDYVIAAGDARGPTFRKEANANYKAHRAPMEDDLAAQIDEAKELFAKFGIPLVELSGFEADDVIATIVHQFEGEQDLGIEILSSDSDLLQLVDDGRVVTRSLKKGVTDTTVLDRAAVLEKYGITPEQVPAYKALVGDTSDNVPGVPGVGPKTASQILADYPTIEEILANLDKLPKFAAKLPDDGSQLRASLFLTTLRRDVPVTIPPLAELVRPELNRRELRDYFHQVGFLSLASALAPKDPLAPAPKKRTIRKAPAAPTTFARTDVAVTGPAEPVTDLEAFMDDPSVRPAGQVVTGYGIKEALQVLWASGRDLAPPYDDLGIAAWLLYPDLKAYEDEAVRSVVAGGESAPLAELRQKLFAALEKENMAAVYRDLELPTIRLLAEAEARGIHVDREALESLAAQVAETCDSLEKEIHSLAGEPFNLNSPKQVADVLFRKLYLAMPGKKKESTRAEILDELRDAHPIVGMLLDYREHFKVRTSFVEPILARLDAEGTLRTEYVQTGAATGRLSSRNPNLQNIPQESRWSHALRDTFTARDGYLLASFDYSQLELRIVASLSGDPALTRAFQNGEDVHSATAAIVLGKDPSAITKEERRIAKTLNFGLVYGMGVTAFAKASGLKRAQAQEFIDRYFQRFGAVKAWQETVLENARKTGYTETLTGRRRYFPELAGGAPSWRTGEIERAAINQPVQGLDADIAKKAMVQVREALGEEGYILLTIHDELLLELPAGSIKSLVPKIRSTMEGIMPELGVPLVVDVRTGTRWGSLEPFSS